MLDPAPSIDLALRRYGQGYERAEHDQLAVSQCTSVPGSEGITRTHTRGAQRQCAAPYPGRMRYSAAPDTNAWTPTAQQWDQVRYSGTWLNRPDGTRVYLHGDVIGAVLTVKYAVETASGVKADLAIVETEQPNAFATTHNGKPVIALSLSFLDRLGRDSGRAGNHDRPRAGAPEARPQWAGQKGTRGDSTGRGGGTWDRGKYVCSIQRLSGQRGQHRPTPDHLPATRSARRMISGFSGPSLRGTIHAGRPGWWRYSLSCKGRASPCYRPTRATASARS